MGVGRGGEGSALAQPRWGTTIIGLVSVTSGGTGVLLFLPASQIFVQVVVERNVFMCKSQQNSTNNNLKLSDGRREETEERTTYKRQETQEATHEREKGAHTMILGQGAPTPQLQRHILPHQVEVPQPKGCVGWPSPK